MRRRGFVQACAAGIGCLGAGPGWLLAGGEVTPREYDTVWLVDALGEPLQPSALEVGRNYIFHYPYTGTPCFLLDLGESVPGRNGLRTRDGGTYDWPGGVGPDGSVVAFSAICAHRMAYPTQQVSYIGFRPAEGDRRQGRITCCAENSVYNPYAGGVVESGPAEQPLAAVLLEHDRDDGALYARGTLGGELFQRFFDAFEQRLRLEHPNAEPEARVREEAKVVPLRQFSRNVVRCGAATDDQA